MFQILVDPYYFSMYGGVRSSLIDENLNWFMTNIQNFELLICYIQIYIVAFSEQEMFQKFPTFVLWSAVTELVKIAISYLVCKKNVDHFFNFNNSTLFFRLWGVKRSFPLTHEELSRCIQNIYTMSKIFVTCDFQTFIVPF